MEDKIEGFESLKKYHALKVQMVNTFDYEKKSWTGNVDTYILTGELPKDSINNFIYKNIDIILGEALAEEDFNKEDLVICFNIKNEPNGFIRCYFTFVTQTQKSLSHSYLPPAHEVYRFVDLDFTDFSIEEQN